MFCKLRRAVLSLTVLGVLVLTSTSLAGQLLPNGNGDPHSAGPVNTFLVSLIPDPASYRSETLGCPWLIPAAQAAAQPYNNATNVWNFSYAAAGTFNGTFTLTTYAATNNGAGGGANFEITYTPGKGDPTDGNVRWVQVIDTNLPSARGVTYGVKGTGVNGIPVGTTAYLDNAGPGAAGTPVDPYYGWLTVPAGGMITDSEAANAMHFVDTPFLPLVNGRDWEAQVFLSSETDITANGVTTHNVTFYGGVWYGFQDVAGVAAPEPSSFVLVASGFGFIVLVRGRKLLGFFRIGEVTQGGLARREAEAKY